MNAMISLYPKLKYTDEIIEEIKNMNMRDNNIKKEGDEGKKDITEENNIKEEEELKEKDEKEEKSNESDKEKK